MSCFVFETTVNMNIAMHASNQLQDQTTILQSAGTFVHRYMKKLAPNSNWTKRGDSFKLLNRKNNSRN